MIPVLDLAMANRVVYAITCVSTSVLPPYIVMCQLIPGPDDAASASSPMKKSRSSVPLLPDRCPPAPAPPVKKVGLFATAGRPEPDPPAPPAGPLVAIAVGKTKEGESLPANPSLEYPVPLRAVLAFSPCNAHLEAVCSLVHDNGRRLVRHTDLGRPGYARSRGSMQHRGQLRVCITCWQAMSSDVVYGLAFNGRLGLVRGYVLAADPISSCCHGATATARLHPAA